LFDLRAVTEAAVLGVDDNVGAATAHERFAVLLRADLEEAGNAAVARRRVLLQRLERQARSCESWLVSATSPHELSARLAERYSSPVRSASKPSNASSTPNAGMCPYSAAHSVGEPGGVSGPLASNGGTRAGGTDSVPPSNSDAAGSR
jgi:hypothetical protein